MPTQSPRFAIYRSHPELILNLGSCLAVLAIVAIVSYLLARERESVEQSAVRSSNNIVQLIESDILRNVELYDQSLQGLIWAVGRKELPEVPGPIRQRLLFNEAFVDRKRGDVLWLDKQGNVVGDSTSSVPRKANFGDTGVFKAHQHNANLGLLVGPRSRPSLATWTGVSVSADASRAPMASSPGWQRVRCACRTSMSCSSAWTLATTAASTCSIPTGSCSSASPPRARPADWHLLHRTAQFQAHPQ